MTQKELYSECFNPVKVRIFNTLRQRYEVRELPCGNCYHCKITKVNEWVTRMVINSLYYKNVYFGTLTYKITNTYEFDQTQPVMSRCNYRGTLQPTPLVLRKDHLQKFFKRLRKNTKAKFQYFACGELGGKYGRPHYHFILWTDSDISLEDVRKSWSAEDLSTGERVCLGDRLELQDMRKDARNIEHSYKYVCKYLQKKEFDFNKLPTKDDHMHNIVKRHKNLYHNDEITEQTLQDYTKLVCPFTLCSTRPAIGLQYFEDHKDRFAKEDFSLLGLKGKYVFPRYYVRKTKEYLCPYKTISFENNKPTSYSRIPILCTILRELQDNISFSEDFQHAVSLAEYKYSDGAETVRLSSRLNTSRPIELPRKFFEFYDCATRRTYRINDNFIYISYKNKYEYEKEYEITEILNMLESAFSRICHDMLEPFEFRREFKQAEKNEYIEKHYGSADKYQHIRDGIIQGFLSKVKYEQDMYMYIKNQNKNL